MPKLKGVKGFANIQETMDKRAEERKQEGDTPSPSSSVKEEVKKTSPSVETVEKFFSDTFSSIGSTVRKRYESGKMPRLHLIFFEELLKSIPQKEEWTVVILTPICDKLEINRGNTKRILSCLEEYGYIAARKTEERGRPFEFLILKEPE